MSLTNINKGSLKIQCRTKMKTSVSGDICWHMCQQISLQTLAWWTICNYAYIITYCSSCAKWDLVALTNPFLWWQWFQTICAAPWLFNLCLQGSSRGVRAAGLEACSSEPDGEVVMVAVVEHFDPLIFTLECPVTTELDCFLNIISSGGSLLLPWLPLTMASAHSLYCGLEYPLP